MKEEEKLNPVDGEMEGKASFKEDNKDVDNEMQENNGDGGKDKDDDVEIPPLGSTGSNGLKPVNP